MRWFVSRHPGAVEWLAEQGLEVDRMIAHLDIRQIQSGDWVMGTLPVSLAAEVCARGALRALACACAGCIARPGTDRSADARGGRALECLPGD